MVGAMTRAVEMLVLDGKLGWISHYGVIIEIIDLAMYQHHVPKRSRVQKPRDYEYLWSSSPPVLPVN